MKCTFADLENKKFCNEEESEDYDMQVHEAMQQEIKRVIKYG